MTKTKLIYMDNNLRIKAINDFTPKVTLHRYIHPAAVATEFEGRAYNEIVIHCRLHNQQDVDRLIEALTILKDCFRNTR